MAERTYQVQKTQLGVETTPGTAVVATKQLQTTSLETEPQLTVQEFTPLGSKYQTVVADQREWTIAPISGIPSFNELTYWLASILSTTSVAQVYDGTVATGAYNWNFDSAVTSEDTYKTFTIEQGDAIRAQRYAYATVRELGLRFSRSAVSLTGQLIAQRLQDAITLTSSGVTPIPIAPIFAPFMDVFIDSTYTALGTTKLGRLFDATFNFNDRYGAFWTVDSSQSSFAGLVETAPKITLTLILEADANGMAYLTSLRNGSTVFARLKANSVGTGYAAGELIANSTFQPRFDTVTLTSGSTTVPDTSAAAGDVGKSVVGTGIPAGATVTAITAGTSFTLSAAATASGSQTIQVGAAVPYQLLLDLALKVNHIGRFSDQEGIYAIEFGFAGVADPTWGKAIHATLTNALATL